MKLIITLALLTYVASQQVNAQIHPFPDEVCRYQCDVIYCDHFSGYCDYDCYEVCHPYGPYASRNHQESSSKGHASEDFGKQVFKSGNQQGVKGDTQQEDRDETQQDQLHLEDITRSGKVVRMRIQNPSFKMVQRGQIVSTRASPAQSFALIQTCLSKDANKRLKSTEARVLKVQDHLIFGTPDLMIKAKL